ncbi:hypothetical protein ACFW1M_35310 [Streptomyces inhibens]|uniref:hypothetical protein n=1 Tax=Streptomyces inhibens TaxID=2293571 RepID=UPI003674F17E
MEVGNIATWAGVGVTLFISIGGWLDSRRQIRIGREANEISHKQAEAAERRAIAVEDALSTGLRLLAERSSARGAEKSATDMVEQPASPSTVMEPPPTADGSRVRWKVQRIENMKYGFALCNVGSVPALHVKIVPDSGPGSPEPGIARNLPENATVLPHECVHFVMAPTFAHPRLREVFVQWDGQNRPVPVALPSD